jgi:hypothetical protein
MDERLIVAVVELVKAITSLVNKAQTEIGK